MKRDDTSAPDLNQRTTPIELEELFARLTMVLEDAATVAADGQMMGQSASVHNERVGQIGLYLIQASSLIEEIKSRIGTTDG